ncbi:winged helix-turn-helix domain-containing protein [Streptomyces vinaceus]
MFRQPFGAPAKGRLLKCHGWSWQQPARRAIERDDAAVEHIQVQ